MWGFQPGRGGGFRLGEGGHEALPYDAEPGGREAGSHGVEGTDSGLEAAGAGLAPAREPGSPGGHEALPYDWSQEGSRASAAALGGRTAVDSAAMGAAVELDKRGSAIRDMFGAVAPRYDLLNRVLSASLDVVWRRRAAESLTLADPAPVLDLCCGTGDQALALERRGARVVAADFCLPMLALAERKYARLDNGRPHGLAGDALTLPFEDERFSAVTASFGLRNVADLDAVLREIRRVLRPGGETAFLEFTVPSAPLLRAPYLFYFRRVLPWIGRRLSSRGSAYTYLPESVLDFPQREGFLDRMAAAGFDELECRDLSGGIVNLYRGRRV